MKVWESYDFFPHSLSQYTSRRIFLFLMHAFVLVREMQVVDLNVSKTGQGYGRDLMLHLIESFLDKRGRISELTVVTTKDALSNFFAKFGFAEVAREGSRDDGKVVARGNLDLALQR